MVPTQRQVPQCRPGIQSVLTERDSVPLCQLSSLLPVGLAVSRHVASLENPGAPGESIESQIQRRFPEALFPPTRCSHAFLKEISVLATGKGGIRSVSLREQNGQKTFVEVLPSGKVPQQGRHLVKRSSPSSLSPGHCPAWRALNDSLFVRANRMGLLIFSIRPVLLLASWTLSSLLRFRGPCAPRNLRVLLDLSLTLTLTSKPSASSVDSASSALQPISFCISFLV